MGTIKIVPLIISLPKSYRDQLRKIAAEQNFHNPDEISSAARLGREIIISYLDSLQTEVTSNDRT